MIAVRVGPGLRSRRRADVPHLAVHFKTQARQHLVGHRCVNYRMLALGQQSAGSSSGTEAQSASRSADR